MEVYLNVYDYFTWNSTLQKCGLGVYHTGVEINNIEYCYCVVDSDPNTTGIITIVPQTADYHFNRKIFIGVTTCSQYALFTIIRDLQKKYTCGEYNIFSNNCNHFSQQLIRNITQQQVPRSLFRITNCLKYSCCCLPKGLVSGQWQLQRMRKQQQQQNNRQLI